MCDGLLAELYENSGGRVQLHGKPDPLMYQRVHDLAQQQLDKTIEKDKILMVGDSFITDIKGANPYEIDSFNGFNGRTQVNVAALFGVRRHFYETVINSNGHLPRNPDLCCVGVLVLIKGVQENFNELQLLHIDLEL